jgi:uncharacterized repeat protein (TIGR01451 family)
MKAPKALIIAATTGIFVSTTIVLPATASQPKGTIKKTVQNQTTNSKRQDADNADTALAVKSGDVLKFIIEITNGGDKPMESTKLNDTLPPGIELTKTPSLRQISENIGTIAPGKTDTKTFVVRVTSDKQGETIENKACFTGNNQANDAPQDGCDSAVVTVTGIIPQRPSAPKANAAPAPKTEPAKPQEKAAPQPEKSAPKTEEGKAEEGKQPVTPPAPIKETLPSTGPATALAPVAAVSAGALGYAARLLLLRRRPK